MVYKCPHGYEAEWEPATEYIRKTKWINGQEPDSSDDDNGHGHEFEVVFDLDSPSTPANATATNAKKQNTKPDLTNQNVDLVNIPAVRLQRHWSFTINSNRQRQRYPSAGDTGST